MFEIFFAKINAYIYIADSRKNTGRFIMFSVIANIYTKKSKGPTLIQLFPGTGRLKKFYFDN
jgi:hypothetical protein